MASAVQDTPIAKHLAFGMYLLEGRRTHGRRAFALEPQAHTWCLCVVGIPGIEGVKREGLCNRFRASVCIPS